jgi:dihydroneopterin aldolase/2-amino-4-hydroxy-6-hydroxymethyldihydropteridine diphosphokinase/dihydropteroate synthase
MINDVRGGREEGMLQVMAQCGIPVVLMHSRGDSTSMTSSALQDYSSDGGVIPGVKKELGEVIKRALEAGVKEWDIILDPGIGFAKSHEDNLALLRGLPQLSEGELSRYPMLVGASRKGFVGKVTGRTIKAEAAQRGWGDAVINAWCTLNGGEGVNVLRVHDVRGAVESVRMAEALRGDTAAI